MRNVPCNGSSNANDRDDMRRKRKDSIFDPGRFVAEGSKEEWKEHLTSVMQHFKLQKIHFKNEAMKEIKPGCVLEWNQEERSFDCPCHGSRFTCTGELLNGPVRDDLKEISK